MEPREPPVLASRVPFVAGIEAAHSRVMFGRVNGTLAVSRAIGDFEYKPVELRDPPVSCVPDVTVLTRQSLEEFVLIACDGVRLYRSLQMVLVTYEYCIQTPLDKKFSRLMIDFMSSKLLIRHFTLTQIFDVFQNQELVSFTEYLMRVHESLIDVANEILDTALQRVRLSFFLKSLQYCTSTVLSLHY